MARRRRIQFPGAVYHVMARGNRRARIFEDEVDCERFIHLLAAAAERYKFQIYAVCLMVNHYHVVGETPRGNLAETMRFVNGVYAQGSNRRHRRTGHLFEARYRSLLVQRESYLKRVARYVVLNPVRARLAPRAAAWRWSTYRATAGLESVPEWLSLEWLDWAFGAHSRMEAIQRYQDYVNEPPRSNGGINTRALAVGGRPFRERMVELSREVPLARSRPIAGPSRVRPSLGLLFADATRSRPAMRLAIYTAHVKHGYPQGQIARHLDIHPSAVSRMLRRFWRPR
jgi:putative transposase